MGERERRETVNELSSRSGQAGRHKLHPLLTNETEHLKRTVHFPSFVLLSTQPSPASNQTIIQTNQEVGWERLGPENIRSLSHTKQRCRSREGPYHQHIDDCLFPKDSMSSI